MSKQNAHSKFILELALFHRYGWLIALFISVQLFPHHLLSLISAFLIAFAAWSFIGCKRKWTHIYCSYQNAYHKAMTPNAVNWNSIKKKRMYTSFRSSFSFWESSHSCSPEAISKAMPLAI